MKMTLFLLVFFWVAPLEGRPFSSPFTSTLSFCRKAFSGSRDFPESLFPENFRDPLTQTILREHFTAQDLRWFDKLKTNDFLKGLFKLTEFSKDHHALSKETRIFLERAAEKIPEIMEFVKEAPEEEAPHLQQITLTVLATFSKHLPEALTMGSEADWGQISLTLKNIAEFDKDKPRWSLYKIKRSIKKRYDLEEYLKCRM